jgi:uncharacterized protein YodC (DUF2158 family)
MDFKPGAIVQLKSGGRALTVIRQTKDEVELVWFGESDDAIHKASVPAACLSEIEFADDEDLDDED